MSTADPTMHELRDALSLPAPQDETSVSRRRFLQAVTAGVGISMLPTWMADMAAASPGLPSTPGNNKTLVLVVLDGGCDGLHMVAPVGAGAYHDARGDLALPEDTALEIGGGRGFHPALSRLKARYDVGDVAVIDGVGNARRDLSHFSAMADFQHGGPAAQFSHTGWLGRWLDQSSGGPFEAIAIGHRIPLVAHGASRSAMTLPSRIEYVPQRHGWAAPLDAAIEGWGQIDPDRGALAACVAQATSAMIPSADELRPSYPTSSPNAPLVSELQLCANLLNAGLGTRVLTVRHGPYDSHTNQAEMLGSRLSELDAAIDLFFRTLDAAVADEVTLVCISEFGRRVAANGGGGTDHGAGNSMIAVGSGVVGGLHGTLPSLTSLTSDGNLRHEIDYRSVFATVLEEVLETDHASILGDQFDIVPFIDRGESRPSPGHGKLGRSIPRVEAVGQVSGVPQHWTPARSAPHEPVAGTTPPAPQGRSVGARPMQHEESEGSGLDRSEVLRWISSTKEFSRKFPFSIFPR